MELHPLPWYQWRWQQFRLSRKVGRMDYIQRGLYRDLLDEQWEKGSVSGNVEDMADICGCPVDVMASAWQVIIKCFDLVDGRYINATLEEQRTVKDRQRVQRQEAGRKGGEAKAQRNQEESSKCQASAKQTLAPSQDKIRLDKIRKEEKREDNTVPDKPARHARVSISRPGSVEQEVWESFMAQCKAKQKPATAGVIKKIEAEATAAAISLNDALRWSADKGYARFEAEWYLKENPRKVQEKEEVEDQEEKARVEEAEKKRWLKKRGLA